mmetsp:Transcript_34900/g.81629  ORF Transcript_34900/g.81629 Transcript_34900/m.81629 type:complete len:277 (+) Transcript_34900:12-842(+)
MYIGCRLSWIGHVQMDQKRIVVGSIFFALFALELRFSAQFSFVPTTQSAQRRQVVGAFLLQPIAAGNVIAQPKSAHAEEDVAPWEEYYLGLPGLRPVQPKNRPDSEAAKLFYDPSRQAAEKAKAAKARNAELARRNLLGSIASVVVAAERLRDQEQRWKAKKSTELQLGTAIKQMVIDERLEEDMVRAAFLLNIDAAFEPRLAAMEELEILLEALPAPVAGEPAQKEVKARRDSSWVLERLQGAREELEDYLACFPKDYVTAAKDFRASSATAGRN